MVKQYGFENWIRFLTRGTFGFSRHHTTSQQLLLILKSQQQQQQQQRKQLLQNLNFSENISNGTDENSKLITLPLRFIRILSKRFN